MHAQSTIVLFFIIFIILFLQVLNMFHKSNLLVVQGFYWPCSKSSIETCHPIKIECCTSLSPCTMPGPGTAWALTIWAQSLILYMPPLYWCFTVLPMSANFLQCSIVYRKIAFKWSLLIKRPSPTLWEMSNKYEYQLKYPPPLLILQMFAKRPRVI